MVIRYRKIKSYQFHLEGTLWTPSTPSKSWISTHVALWNLLGTAGLPCLALHFLIGTRHQPPLHRVSDLRSPTQI